MYRPTSEMGHASLAVDWPGMLASNLAIGAALCDSFISGRAYQMAEDIDPATKQWRPGHAIDTLRAALEKL